MGLISFASTARVASFWKSCPKKIRREKSRFADLFVGWLVHEKMKSSWIISDKNWWPTTLQERNLEKHIFEAISAGFSWYISEDRWCPSWCPCSCLQCLVATPPASQQAGFEQHHLKVSFIFFSGWMALIHEKLTCHKFTFTLNVAFSWAKFWDKRSLNKNSEAEFHLQKSQSKNKNASLRYKSAFCELMILLHKQKQVFTTLRIIGPSKLAILRTLPLLYRFKPFHWRVQDP